MTKARRPGRPWSPAKGHCAEINDLVQIVRTWLDQAGLTVGRLHGRLTPDHFVAGAVPELRRLRSLLAGEGLTWDLVEAVADVCFPDEPGPATAQRLKRARTLWDAAEVRPTVIGTDGEPAVSARDLLQAQQRALTALEELNRVRQAYEASERSRYEALRMATVLFALLGQTQAQVAQLTRRLDALHATPDAVLTDVTATHRRLGRAQAQEEDLRVQLARAESERVKAQGLADIAARRIQALEAELRDLRGTQGSGVPRVTGAAVSLPEPADNGLDEDAALDRIDAALHSARLVLDREHEAVEDLADELGWRSSPAAPEETGSRVADFPGRVVGGDAGSAEGGRGTRLDGELSGTTLNNPTVQFSGPGTEIAVRAASDRMRFVGAATRRIARGMDLDEIVLGLCRATVPIFCDGILVYLRDPLPVGDARPVGPVVLRLRRIDRAPLDLDAESGQLPLMFSQADLSPAKGRPPAERRQVEPGGPLAEVLRGVRPVFSGSAVGRAAVTDLLGEGHSVPGSHYGVLAPLRGRRRVIGMALFLRRPDRPAFQEDDLLVAGQLATHTALGAERTVLHGREVYIADELQRTMLPQSLPQPAGVRLAARYLPSADTARVGGDWYEAIPLPGNRVALMVGDVLGHSMTSAAVMGQLRTTAQSAAGLDLPPREVLHHLDEQAQRLGPDRMATFLYVVYDPVSHRITIANAGHPPPVLLHQGGRAEVLEVPPGAPIGVGGVDFEEVEVSAPAGATLVLYTDGLVEFRLQDAETGIELLRERLAVSGQLAGPDHSPHLEAMCDEVLGMPGPGDRDDDIALLAARFEGITPSDVAYWFLEPEDAAPGRARRLIRHALERWGIAELSDTAELLVSELVTNAVRYAERPIALRLLRTQVLRCEIGDDSPHLPRNRFAQSWDEPGRGLMIVNKLADRWGATRLATGKVVWFEVSLHGASSLPHSPAPGTTPPVDKAGTRDA